jgi:hypothetical protein
MILISHRGNLNGPEPDKENKIFYILEALWAGYDVEVDVRGKDGKLYLGHDECQESIDYFFLANKRLWVHAKNPEAVELLLEWKNSINWFWHQEDDFVFTTRGDMWVYPGRHVYSGSIAVMPELSPGWDIIKAGGICSDLIETFKSKCSHR